MRPLFGADGLRFVVPIRTIHAAPNPKYFGQGRGVTDYNLASDHGKRGELRQRYREGQEDQLGALGLVVNVIVLRNTIYMDAAIEQLRSEAMEICDQDKSRLSPLDIGTSICWDATHLRCPKYWPAVGMTGGGYIYKDTPLLDDYCKDASSSRASASGDDWP